MESRVGANCVSVRSMTCTVNVFSCSNRKTKKKRNNSYQKNRFGLFTAKFKFNNCSRPVSMSQSTNKRTTNYPRRTNHSFALIRKKGNNYFIMTNERKTNYIFTIRLLVDSVFGFVGGFFKTRLLKESDCV